MPKKEYLIICNQINIRMFPPEKRAEKFLKNGIAEVIEQNITYQDGHRESKWRQKFRRWSDQCTVMNYTQEATHSSWIVLKFRRNLRNYYVLKTVNIAVLHHIMKLSFIEVPYQMIRRIGVIYPTTHTSVIDQLITRELTSQCVRVCKWTNHSSIWSSSSIFRKKGKN